MTTEPLLGRRDFDRAALVALFGVVAASSGAPSALAQNQPSGSSPTRRNVIKQELPGDPPREMLLLEVTYPPGTGSPPHLHANGVMAFVVAGTIASKVNDGPEQVFRAGDAWWEPPGAVHRVSRNASASEPATLLAIYVAPKGAAPAELMKPL